MNLYEEYPSELYHYGIKGMKWGKRKARYESSTANGKGGKTSNNPDDKQVKRKSNVTKAVAIGAAVAGTALAAYGGYKLSKYVKERNIHKAKRTVEQMDYLRRNINNIQSHVDPSLGYKNNPKYDHAYKATLRSVSEGIKGDEKLYGRQTWYKDKYPNGRNAASETKRYMMRAIEEDIKSTGTSRYFNR